MFIAGTGVGAGIMGVFVCNALRDDINIDLTDQQEHIVKAGLVDIEELRGETKRFVDEKFDKYIGTNGPVILEPKP